MAAPQALTPEQIAQIVAAGRGNTVNLNGTIYQGNYADTGSGETFQEGALQDIYGYTPDQNKVGGTYNQYDPTGVFSRTGTQQEVNSGKDFLEFLGGSAALFALPGALNGSLFGGAGASGLTTSELAAADMALGGVGGTAGAEALASAAAAGGTTLTASQLANLAKAGINVAGLLGATNAISNMGGNTSTAAPITYSGGGAGGYSPEYFSQVQSTYNQLMPGVPRDVASPLQQWYSTEFNPGASVTGSLFGDMTGGTSTTTGLKPTTPTNIPKVVDKAPTNTPFEVPVGTKLGSPAYEWAVNQGGMTSSDYLNNINQWILDNPNADRALIDTTMDTLGVSDADLQEALRTTTFSDATKYALTHDMSLADVNKNIVDWLAANPAASNAQIQAEQSKYGVSDFDVARALTEQNASAAKEYAIIQDMGLDQYYQNIANAAQSGISAAEAAAQMKQYGVSPTDVKTAYSMFAPKAGLTLDEVLAAYK